MIAVGVRNDGEDTPSAKSKDYTFPMFELVILMLCMTLLLPDLVFGAVLFALWLAEHVVLGICHFLFAALAFVSWAAAMSGKAWRRNPPNFPR